MHCFICVTYMIILTSANPWIARDLAPKQEQRSLFRDVIESLRIRSRPEEINHNDDNNISQNYERYGYENEPLQLPSDADFIPRRNDRLEMPRLKHRFPKNLDITNGEKYEISKDMDVKPKDRKEDDGIPKEVVVYIDSHDKTPKPTQKPKQRPQLHNKQKPIKMENSDESQVVSTEDYMQLTNTMAGQSQIGNRETQTVIKPTVIVNLRGTVSHTDSDIRLERRGNNTTLDTIPRNVFNINQEINVERESGKKEPNKLKQQLKVLKDGSKVEEDMMMCETVSYKSDSKIEGGRKFDNVLQILFSI
ncbi:Uncharacterized protein OBRU01_18039 [Operophtera brumata]|uniref:Uncharacterized protein n=1 Tax=Operophtera brumata TaxID=104452 RepID=A0A0L7KZU4_OPEBR|nr:Uncharacterized protein OBRU01_18039 [Operophtera brumata]